ncbi:hypothetical protein IWW39_004488 [Coemansia spiralis]|uniref:Uncharacterized protein n=1 Tax=Coemansia spiralis TaxID=417178 RepID=A0A9W8GJB7_9FUNG|nr:hypothetical protein IWW39_004488 [Coemansia spiralis]
MAISHREENFVVIELGSHTTKATIDTTDINRLPTTVIRTRAGVLKQDVGAVPLSSDSEPVVKQNGVHVNGVSDMGEAPEASVKTAEENDEDLNTSSELNGNDPNYIFGSALETAEDGSVSQTMDIICEGFVSDWDVMSAFLRHVITKELGVRISSNVSPILFSVPPLWPKTDLECLAQIAFEDLNAPSILIVEQPLLALYGNNAATGLVVDFGHTATTVTAILDSTIQWSCIAQSGIAGAAVTERLHKLLQHDAALCAEFGDGGVPLEFAVALKESGLCKLQLLPVGDDYDSDGGNDGVAQPELLFRGRKYKVKADMLDKAVRILIAPDDDNGVGVASLMKQVVLGCETEKRAGLWESIHVVGGSSRFGGLKDCLQMELEKTVLPSSNIYANSQTRETKFGSLPDYFSGWRGRDYLAGFLGACIVAKVALNDSKHNISRSEYNDSGPSVVHTKSF